MNNSNIKSATTAGLLAIFLGTLGAHEWYLGNKKKATIHLSLTAGGILLNFLAGFLPLMTGNLASAFTIGLTWSPILFSIGGLVLFASGVWAFIDGIRILIAGDQGLAMMGYQVAGQMPMHNMGYGMQQGGMGQAGMMNQNGMGQMNMNQNGMGQPNYNMGGQGYDMQNGMGQMNNGMNMGGVQDMSGAQNMAGGSMNMGQGFVNAEVKQMEQSSAIESVQPVTSNNNVQSVDENTGLENNINMRN